MGGSLHGLISSPVLWMCILLFSSGCGGPDYGSPVKVSGTVTVDAKPLAGALVTLHCTEAREPEYSTFVATSSDDGTYELANVYPGAYEVIVAEAGGESGEGMADPGMAAANAGRDLYPADGDLKTQVGDDDHTYDVKLKRGRIPRQ